MPPSLTPQAQAAAPTKKPRRRRRWLLGSAVVLAGVLALGPVLAAPFVRGKVVSGINEALNGELQVNGLSFNLLGRLGASDLSLTDSLGRPVLQVQKVAAKASLLGLLLGRYSADVEIVGFELHVRRNPDGRLNLESLGEKETPERRAPRDGKRDRPATPPPDPEEDRQRDGEPPNISGRVQLRDGSVFLHGDRGTTELRNVQIEIGLDALDEPATLKLSSAAVGPAGPGGSLSLNGSFTVAEDGAELPEGLRADLGLLLEQVDLAAFEPAAQMLGEVSGLAGHLDAAAELKKQGPEAFTARMRVNLEELRVRSPELEEDLRLGKLAFSSDASLDDEGSGTQVVKLSADEFLEFTYEGDSQTVTGDSGAVKGAAMLNLDLAGLSQSLGSLLPLQEGRSVEGKIAGAYDLTADFRNGDVSGGSLNGNVKVRGLAGRNADGSALDLGDLKRMDLVVEGGLLDGNAEIRRLELRAGPIQASGHAQLRDLAGEDPNPTLGDTELVFDADLDRLAATLEKLVDLGGLSFGGRVTARSLAKDTNGRIEAESSVKLAGLQLAVAEDGAVRRLGPLDLSVEQLGVLDSVPGGVSKLTRLHVESPFLQADASGEFTDLFDADKVAGTLQHEFRFDPTKASQALGDFLGETRFAGELLQGSGSIELGREAWKAEGDLAVPATRFSGPSFGTEGVEVPGMALQFRAERKATRIDGRLGVEGELLEGGGTWTVGNLGMEDQGLVMLADLELKGEVDPLLRLASAFQPDLADTRGQGSWELRFRAKTKDGRNTLSPALDLRQVAFRRPDLPAADPADLSLRGEVLVDTRGDGVAELQELAVNGPGIKLEGSGRSDGFSLDREDALLSRFDGELTLEPTPLGAWLQAFLGEAQISGVPFVTTLEASGAGSRYEAKAALSAPQIEVRLAADPEAADPAPRKLIQQNVDIQIALRSEAAAERAKVTVEKAEYRSLTATAALSGELLGGSDSEEATGDLKLRATGDVARMLADLGEVAGLRAWQGAGELALDLDLEGADGSWQVSGTQQVTNLDLKIPGEGESAPVQIRDPKLELTLDTRYATEPGDLEIRDLRIQSTFLSGEVKGRLENLSSLAAGSGKEAQPDVVLSGLIGEFRYVPDQLGALIGPWLPGRLSGASEERTAFHFDGRWRELGGLGILRNTSGKASVGLGRFTMAGLDARGGVELESEGQKATARSNLQVNDGTLALVADLDLRESVGADEEPPKSRIHLTMNQVKANTELSPGLGRAHPLLAGLDESPGGALFGLLNMDLTLRYEGFLTAEQLAGGWDGLLQGPVSGRGTLALDQAKISGSPLLSQLFGHLGAGPAEQKVALAPVKFRVGNGRLRYEEPWTWTIGGLATNFTGSVGFDQSLQLAWNVLITEELAGRNSLLGELAGQKLVVPVGGTLEDPKLDFDGAVKGLAKQLAESRLEGAIGQKAEELGIGEDVLGGLFGKDEEDPAKAQAEKDAAELFRQADELWDAGNKKDAAEIYKRLRTDFKETELYRSRQEQTKARIQEARDTPGSRR